jgi:cytochrome b subunit of formate dehydrogenase
MTSSRKSGWARPLLPLVLLAAAPALWTQTTDCTSCHEQGQKVSKSAHAAVACTTCHVKHENFPHPEGVPKPACTGCHTNQATDYDKGVHGQAVKKGNAGAPDCALCHGSAHEMQSPKSQAFRMAVPETCNMCHSEVVEQYRGSVHGQALARGIPQAPLCTDCHGEHAILAPSNANSSVAAGHVRDTCGNCHGNVRLSRKFGIPSDRMVTFDASFHGLAAKSGNQTVANCASCHGVHNILASANPKSTVNAKNLAQTCGKCHEGAGQRFAITPVHVIEGRTEPSAVRWTRQFYLLLIPLTIGLMLLHNFGDWVRKLFKLRAGSGIRHRVETDEYTPEVRMLGFERAEHIVLVTSFVILVWTGFALKYPDQWWARPLLFWEGARSLRSLVHRTAAVVFIAVSVTHLLSLMFSRRLREHWKEMWPKASDATEALANLSYNVGIRSVPPGRSAHSYIEKAEYWAVVWGAVVMAASGIMLWANNLMLKFLPKTWLDVATTVHFYEAVLATIAIVVWHFYGVIFDPDVYPMDTAWYTGVSVKKHELHEQIKEEEKAEAAKQ